MHFKARKQAANTERGGRDGGDDKDGGRSAHWVDDAAQTLTGSSGFIRLALQAMSASTADLVFRFPMQSPLLRGEMQVPFCPVGDGLR